MPLAARAGLALGFAAEPGARDAHEVPTPRVGGLVVFGIWMSLILILTPWPLLVEWAPVAAAFASLVLVGAWDDRFGLNPWLKFAAQVAVAIVVVQAGGLRIDDLGDLFGAGPVELGPLSIPFSVICVVLMINAMNMIDGLDGLCAGLGVTMLGFLGAPWAPMGALAGFLVYNLRTPWRARSAVILGDAGSMTLGLLIAQAAMGAAEPVLREGLPPIAVAWVLAVPVMDALAVFARRVAQGKSPLVADRGHIHHRLMDAGLTHGQAAAALLAAGAACGLIGVGGAAAGVPEWALAAAWAALCLAHIGATVWWGRAAEKKRGL
jgi:UDP-GlcNAc:undecaprenyl-phosphate/decaprenyl-phosphate GlcNAc-1-phosphate transferase